MKLVFTEDELRNVDSAIPQPWADSMRDHGIQPFYYVWNYNEPTRMGAPVNLCERFYEKFGKVADVEMVDVDRLGALHSAQSLIIEALKLEV